MIRARLAAWILAVLVLGGCRSGDDRPPDPARADASEHADPPEPAAVPAWMRDAAFDGRYDPTALIEFLAGLPRPTPTGSPLVAVFASGIEALGSAGPRDRLAGVGLRADAEIQVSIRALDGRAASTRKRLGELVSDSDRDSDSDPDPRAELTSEAATLGIHVRMSLPVADPGLLAATVVRVVMGPGSWAPTCATLTDTRLCTGRERLLVWARPSPGARMQVDAIYLFHAGADPAQLAWIVDRADHWASADTPGFSQPAAHDFELLVRTPGTLALIQAEALADAVAAFARDDLDERGYDDYRHLEQALGDLVAPARLFDGLRLDVDSSADAGLRVHGRWLPAPEPGLAPNELFAPLPEGLAVPSLAGACEAAPVCARMAGLSLAPRFAPLAVGPFADSTGATRVVHQAGDRGSILLLLSAWPHVVGTLGSLANAEQGGILAHAQATLVREAEAVGAMLFEVADPERPGSRDRWAGYLRVGPAAFAAVRSLAPLLGLGAKPIALAGVEVPVDRGRFESDGDAAWVYFVDERERTRPGGWLLAASEDREATSLLNHPQEPGAGVETLAYLHMQDLATLAAREQVEFSADPAVAHWLAARRLTLTLSWTAAGPSFELALRPDSSGLH